MIEKNDFQVNPRYMVIYKKFRIFHIGISAMARFSIAFYRHKLSSSLFRQSDANLYQKDVWIRLK